MASSATAIESPDLAESRSGPATDNMFAITQVPVQRIRPEDGLGRKRDRAGHDELKRSIEKFGVLTPITVRLADDGSGDYLLIKGQGRTLACRLLGIESIPAIVASESYAHDEKVQQFLVENVARLKMRPVDRALLIKRARDEGEETSAIAERFGVAATTVRRLLAQLDDASTTEVAALREGQISLSAHGVVARHVDPGDRDDVINALTAVQVRPKDLEAVFTALGWSGLASLGRDPVARRQRVSLLTWACTTLMGLPDGTVRERFRQLALRFPSEFEPDGSILALAAK